MIGIWNRRMYITYAIWTILFISETSSGSFDENLHHQRAHYLMSDEVLRRVFQVEHHSDVPHYEVVKIHSVRHIYSSRRRKRNSDTFSASDSHASKWDAEFISNGIKGQSNLSNGSHSTLFSSWARSDRSSYNPRNGETEKHIFDEERGEEIHRVAVRTYGQVFDLHLRPNNHLLKNSNDQISAWFADAYPSNISYSEAPTEMENIGSVYQDEHNQAAMLLYRDKNDDALLMDGMIGDDLVVKPLPASMRQKLQKIPFSSSTSLPNKKSPFSKVGENTQPHLEAGFMFEDHKQTDESDDYAFLDEYDNLEDEDVLEQSQNNQELKLPIDTLLSDGSKFSLNSSQRRRRIKREAIKSEYHIVYKRKDAHLNHLYDYDFMEAIQFPFNDRAFKQQGDEDVVNEPILSRKKRQAPFLIFPEILCIIDYDGYRLHGKDNTAIKRYVISFWNGIDLRYRLLKGPAVKISIAGIIISRGRDATPYLERNRVGRDALDAASALTDMGKYLFLERRLPVYDIAVAITKLDMCRKKTRRGECNRGTAGFAYVGGACVVNKRLEKVNSVAIVEDTGGFSGIIVAAHELGHLLGAVHDGSPPPTYLGGPGAKKCRWEDGFIMSDLRHTSKGFRWSQCAIKQFHHFLNGETATCMYNSPHETDPLPKVLPGKLLTLDAQCRKDRGTSACFKDDRVCSQLFCFDAESGYCVSYRPAAEGSRCGSGQICLSGKCVFEHENSLDYDDFGFLRRLGIAKEKESETTAKPNIKRKWWKDTALTTPETPSKTTSKTTIMPPHMTSSMTSIQNITSRTTAHHNPVSFLSTTATDISSTTVSTSSTSTLPWWKRIHRSKNLSRFFSAGTTTTTTTTTQSTTKAKTIVLQSASLKTTSGPVLSTRDFISSVNTTTIKANTTSSTLTTSGRISPWLSQVSLKNSWIKSKSNSAGKKSNFLHSRGRSEVLKMDIRRDYN